MNSAIESTAAEPLDPLRFFWIRENAPGRLEYDSGLTIDSSDLILAILGVHPKQRRRYCRRRRDQPMAARELMCVAERIRACAAQAAGDIEVHMPFIGRREWPSRQAILSATEFAAQRDRILPRSVLDPPGGENVYMARLIGASAADPSAGAELRYSISRPTWGPFADVLLPVPCAAPALLGAAEAEIELSLSAAACRSWNAAPGESNTGYFRIHAHVSMALQSALRRWAAFWWLTDPERLEKVPASYAMLAYRSGSTFPGKRRTEFTYDTMSTEWFRPFYRHARKPLKALLRSIRPVLLRAGRDNLANKYFPAYTRYILDRVRRQRRLLSDLVTCEGAIVNDILRFGLDLRGADPREAARAGARCAKRLGAHLRSFLPDDDFTAVAPVLLFEATNALHVTLGGEPALRFSLHVRAAGDPASTHEPEAHISLF